MENVPVFRVAGMQQVKVLEVYDGDTAWIAFYFNGKPYRARARMDGYDSCEMRPRLDLPNREEHIAKAIASKVAFEALVLGKVLQGSFNGVCKYGRPLVRLFPGNANISELMISGGFGVAYAGGQRVPSCG